jgi:Xaa-Pro dipeptidase
MRCLPEQVAPDYSSPTSQPKEAPVVTNVEVLEGRVPEFDPLPFTDGEYRRRLDGLRALMRERGLDAFVSFTPENIYYLSAHDSPGYYFYQACVVTHDRPPINVLRRIETTNTLGRGWARLAVGYEDRADPVEATLGLLAELGVIGRTVGAEAESWFVSPKRYRQLEVGIEAEGGSLVDASMLVEHLRVTKSDEELTLMRRAAKATGKAMRVAVAASHEGTTEDDVAAAVLASLASQGSEYAGLPPFITSGPRTSLCHSTWAGRVYERGDVLNYELPSVFKRYVAPLFRCGVVGPPEPTLSRNAGMVIEALGAVIDAIKPGRTSHEVHQASKAVFAKHGHPDQPGHRTGYSIGINYPPDWGEGYLMSIWDGDERPLRPGMTFHLVPGFFDLGRYAIVISESVLVTNTGCDVLTDFPRELFVC